MSKKPFHVLPLLMVTWAAAGCGIEPATLQSLSNAVHTVSRQAAQRPPVETPGEIAELDFDPPYPDRTDPFSFPNDAPVADQAKTSITTVAQIEVLGFAEIDEPRVFLRTKDMTKSLGVGESTDGVQVVAIHSPTVELKMGTLVWTASMFENSSVAPE